MIDDEIEPDFETDADMADFEDSSFEDFETGGGSGGGLADSPLAKVGIVFGVLIVIVVAVVLFGGGKEEIENSAVGRGSDVSDLPGSGDISPTYRDAIEEHNVEDYEAAVRTGTSSMPVLTAPARDALDVSPALEAEEDPLERWRRIQEERKVQEAQQAATIVPEEDNFQGEMINNLAQLMAEQMGTVLDSTEISSLSYMEVATDEFLEEDEEESLLDAAALSDAEQRAEEIKTLIPAGTIEYGQLITEANSDAQAPILGQIVSGPARGARLIGSFEVKEEFLVISFNTLVLDGESYPIDALALNPETTTPGLVTDIDHRYFRRILLPAAAAFIEGMSSAIVDSQGTSVTNTSGGATVEEQPELDTKEQIFKGVEEAAGVISEILTENADNVEPLIIVAPGTPLAIMFLDEVTEDVETENDPLASAGLVLPE